MTSQPSDTFCILPWKFLVLTHWGTAKMCCLARPGIRHEGQELSIEHHGLEEIWNADDMQKVRADMAAGKSIPACEECYRLERSGSASIRQIENQAWANGWLNEDRVSIEALKSQAAAEDYRLTTKPIRLQLYVGSRCNLKCRMCNGVWSSRINLDPVHRAWTGLEENDWAAKTVHREHWFQQAKVVRDHLLTHADELRLVEFLGGETLLAPEVGEILQYLVDRGVAQRISLAFTTNATTTKAPWLPLTEHFAGTRFSLSMDGFGEYYEYIRYPGRWMTVVRNVETLRRLPRTQVSAHVTFQGYNALNVVELFHHLDAIGLPFTAYPLQSPPYLQAVVLPPRARKLAAGRLRDYVARGCRPEHRQSVAALAALLETARDEVHAELLREFMLFTNDLDASRGQNFRKTHRELIPFFEEAGFPWTEEKRHAGRVALPLAGAIRNETPGGDDATGCLCRQEPGRLTEGSEPMRELPSHVERGAEYDRQTLQVMRCVLRRDSNCIDLGAHNGDVLKQMIELAPAGIHHAVEALPPFAEGLRQRFPGVRVHQLAVGDSEAEADFQYVENDPAYSGLRRRVYDRPDPQILTIRVRLATVDSIVPSDQPIAFVKIDLEGGEYHAMKGAVQTIRRCQPVIVFEAGTTSTGLYDVTGPDICDLVSDTLGYQLSTMARWLAGESAMTRQEFCHNWDHGLDFYFIATPPGARADSFLPSRAA
jgi:FkbM family methyltransferase